MDDGNKCLVAGGVVGVMLGFLLGLMFIGTLHTDQLQELKDQLRHDKSGMISVKIIEENTGFDNKPWYLLEASDGQRGSINYRRGKVGDTFLMAKDDIGGYHKLPKPGDNTDPVSPIVLTPAK